MRTKRAPSFIMETPKEKRAQKGVDFIRVTVPAARAEELRKKAAAEGISVQALIAPVLNAFARGEIKARFVEQTA